MLKWRNSTMLTLGVVLALVTGPLQAAGEIPTAVIGSLAKVIPGLKIEDVTPTPLPGLYEVAVAGRVIYVSADGRYMVRGEIIDLERRLNLTELRRKVARVAELANHAEKDMIVFSPEQTKYTVTVFTDVDCGYCAKLHRGMVGYNELGIAVRYMAFPRAGIGSPSYHKMVSVWCADNPQEAIGIAKSRRPVEPKTCDNPVERQFEAGRALGVNGTPTIVLQDGSVVPGYVKPDELLGYLKEAGKT